MGLNIFNQTNISNKINKLTSTSKTKKKSCIALDLWTLQHPHI